MPDNTNQEFGSVGIVGTNTAPSMDNIDKKLDEIIVELKEINKNITNNKVAEVTPIIEPETVTPDFSSEEKLTVEEPVKEAEDNMTTEDLTDEINRAIEKIRKEKEMEETNEPSFTPVNVATMPEEPKVIDINDLLSEVPVTEQIDTPVMESTNQPVVNETPVVEPVKNDPIIIPETVPADTPIVPTAPVEAPVVAPASAPIEVPTVAPATAPIEPANEVTDKTIELKPDVLVNDNNVVAPAQEVSTNDAKATVVTSMYPSSFTVKVGDGAQRYTSDFNNEKLVQKQVEKTLVMNNAA